MSAAATHATSLRICLTCGEPLGGPGRSCLECFRGTFGREREKQIRDEAHREGYRKGRADALFDEVARRHVGLPPRLLVSDVFGVDVLRDMLKLVHPDHQPPERAELANRITALVLTVLKGDGR
jgi:hypothetical protein